MVFLLLKSLYIGELYVLLRDKFILILYLAYFVGFPPQFWSKSFKIHSAEVTLDFPCIELLGSE